MLKNVSLFERLASKLLKDTSMTPKEIFPQKYNNALGIKKRKKNSLILNYLLGFQRMLLKKVCPINCKKISFSSFKLFYTSFFKHFFKVIYFVF